MNQAIAGQLAAHVARLRQSAPAQGLAQDPERATRWQLGFGPLSLNFGRERLDQPAFDALLALAAERDLGAAFERLFGGEVVNASEDRAALHTALRGDLIGSRASRAARAEALAAREQMRTLSAQLVQSQITDIIHVGIGGSDLGPRLVIDALAKPAASRFKVHFLANVDGHAVAELMARLDPQRCAVVLVSKSFNTPETRRNGATLKRWLGNDSQLYAVTANAAAAHADGVPEAHVLPLWDWVGGRFSLWSPVGWSIALALGDEAFDALLDGAAEMDRHALGAAAADNMAIVHALLAVWHRTALGLPGRAVVAYDQRLAQLVPWMQQLMMESLGKSVTADGEPLLDPSAPLLFGGVGTDVQHSFFQALHQGTETVALELIGVIHPDHALAAHHTELLANLLAQGEALANGKDSPQAHQRYPGGRGSSTLLLERLDPHSLGMLLALYEHSTYVQAILLGINAFDQWGVELGKRVAREVGAMLKDSSAIKADTDPVTRALLARIRGN